MKSAALAIRNEYGYMPAYPDLRARSIWQYETADSARFYPQEEFERVRHSRPWVPVHRPINYIDTVPSNTKSNFIQLYNDFILSYPYEPLRDDFINRMLNREDTWNMIFEKIMTLTKDFTQIHISEFPVHLKEAWKNYSRWHSELPNVFKGSEKIIQDT